MRQANSLPAFLLMLGIIAGDILSVQAQSFCKEYFPPDGIYSTTPWAVHQRPDGKYWLATGVYEAPARLYVVGLDEQGAVSSSVRLLANPNGGEGYVSGTMTATGDNGCALLLSQPLDSTSDGWILVKMSADAKVEWAKEIAGVGQAGYGVDFLNYSPDGIWVASRLWITSNGLSRTYFARVGLDGKIFWEKILAFPSFLGANTTMLPDGRLLSIINSGSLSPLGHLLALTPSGVLQPIVSFQNTVLMDVVQHPDGRFFFVGHTPDIGVPESQMLLGCWHNGQVQWVKMLSLSREFYTTADLLLNAAADSLTVAVSNAGNAGIRYLLRWDLEGNLVWSRWLPSVESQQSHSVPTADGGLVWVSTSPTLKPVVVKTDANLQVDGCPMAPVCISNIQDTTLQTTSLNWNFQSTTRMSDIPVTWENRDLQSQDYCAPLPPLNAAIFSDTVVCRGTALKFQRDSLATGLSEWRFPGVLANSVMGVFSPSVAFPDTGTFVVTHILSQSGCADTGFQTIRVLDVPQVTLPNDTVFCPGDSLKIVASASPDVSFLWQNGLTTPDRIITTAGIYNVTATNTAGCAASDKIAVSAVTLPADILPADTFFCENDGILLVPKNYAAWQFFWNDGYSEAKRFFETPGIFSFQAESPEGCQVADSVTVSERLKPEIGIVVTSPDSCGRQMLAAENPDLQQFRWSNGATSATAEVVQSGFYSLVASDGFCENSDSVAVEIQPCPECFAYFPNVIKPDSGNENGLFSLNTNCEASAFLIQIFDRWGGLVFETKDVSQGWDGSFRGKSAPPGVFLFRVSAILNFGDLRFPVEKSGTVTVVR
jgi:gliding motility-associated-like protein